MGIQLKKIQNMQRTATFKFLGDDVTFTYRLGAINANLTDWLNAYGNEPDSIRQMIERLVVSWDVLDDEGTPLLPMAETIKEQGIPTPFLLAVLHALGADTTAERLREPGTAERS